MTSCRSKTPFSGQYARLQRRLVLYGRVATLWERDRGRGAAISLLPVLALHTWAESRTVITHARAAVDAGIPLRRVPGAARLLASVGLFTLPNGTDGDRLTLVRTPEVWRTARGALGGCGTFTFPGWLIDEGTWPGLQPEERAVLLTLLGVATYVRDPGSTLGDEACDRLCELGEVKYDDGYEEGDPRQESTRRLGEVTWEEIGQLSGLEAHRARDALDRLRTLSRRGRPVLEVLEESVDQEGWAYGIKYCFPTSVWWH